MSNRKQIPATRGGASRSPLRETAFRTGSAIALVAGYWIAVAMLDAVTDAFQLHYFEWQTTLGELWRDRAVWFGSWVLLSPLIVGVFARAHPARLGWARSIAANLAGQAGLVAIHALVASLLFLAWGPDVEGVLDRGLRLLLTIGLGPRDLAVYWGLAALFYALSTRERNRRDRVRLAELAAESADLSRLLTETKLEALRRELDPHLIFNALNSISTFVRQGDRARALRMLAAMSELLRACLNRSRAELVPLDEELELLDRYLEMERVRLEDMLEVRLSVDAGSGQTLIPPFLLQPIVENAIKHGIDPREGPSVLRIEVVESDGKLWVRVSDGVRLSDGEEEGTEMRPVPGSRLDGIGLSNTRRRLDTLYGPEAGLSLAVGPASACATAWMPIRRASAA